MTQLPLQLSLSPAVSRSRRKRGHVERTSVLAYQDMNSAGRMQRVLRWLISYAGTPTSAELQSQIHDGTEDHTAQLLYVRRGLSDLRSAGLVEHVPHGERTCRVTGRKSVVWRVKGR